MIIYLFALLIGIVAGLRAFMAPTLVSWLAYSGWIDLSGSGLAFFGYAWTPWILSVLAFGELVTDQLPSTPSRTSFPQFSARVFSGGISGAAIGASRGVEGAVFGGLVAGILGAIIGTSVGHSFRARLARAFGKDRPAAFIEDGLAIGGALLIGLAVS